MNYLLIENKGEIDINALILMGGTTKRDDENLIGHFGSGNKYAIALLVSNKIDFKIYSGDKEVEVSTKTTSFRDKQFDQILINGQETSLTTTMGPQWEIWQVVREFVSNAIDEKEYNIINCTDTLEPKSGYTRIYLPHIPEIVEVIDNWDTYFSFDRVDGLVNTKWGNVFPQIDEKEGTVLYRKGIRCYKSVLKSLFHYDLTDYEINESRVIENSYTAGSNTAKFLGNHASKEVAKVILSQSYKDDYWERGFSWYYQCDRLNHNWREAIGGKVIILDDISGFFEAEMRIYPHYRVTKDLAKAIRSSFPDVVIYGLQEDDKISAFRAAEQSNKVKYILQKASEFFTETGYLVNYPIEVGHFSTETQLGGIGVDTIHLSSKVFDLGMKEVVSTIMEENEHLKTKFRDCTREFQNHWINLYLTEKEERFGLFL